MTLLLTRPDIARLMRPADYLEAAEVAFSASKRGLATSPAPLHLHLMGGGLHAKGATISSGRAYAAVKLNANFPDNPTRGLPTIQGVVALFDAHDGVLLALMDSIEITIRRTAAATALAASHLARRERVTVTLCGCGDQASAQLEALSQVVQIAQAYAFDLDISKAQSFSARADLGFPIEAVRDLRRATLESTVVISCTTAKAAFLDDADIRPGTFIAAVGADNPEKSEIMPALMAKAKVVVDALDQCVMMGDLHHAIAAGAMRREDVYASLADVAAGDVAERPYPTDIVIFDSTGTALQDVACAAVVFERATAAGAGATINLNSNTSGAKS
jgi:ornithine cyclodeaminase/alanine dehydrogenase-like protein (mu-crystallin family)